MILHGMTVNTYGMSVSTDGMTVNMDGGCLILHAIGTDVISVNMHGMTVNMIRTNVISTFNFPTSLRPLLLFALLSNACFLRGPW